MFRPKVPFFRTPQHKKQIRSTYKGLLRQAQGFSDPVEQTYLRSWIRERFHYNKRQTSAKRVEQQLSDATWTSLVMDAAIGGAVEQKQMIGDLAYGRTGWLKDVAREIDRYRHPTKPCSWIRDVRPRASRIHQPHRAYRIPLDLRAFTVPQGLLDQIKREDDAEGKQRIRRRMVRERKLAREINAMAAAVNQGNTMVAQSGLLGDAYAYEPSVLHKDHYVEGTTIGNQAWIPPKIKNRQDPPVVQHKRTSIGFEFLRINTRKPPHWLGARIANGYKTVAKRLHTHEFYYYITEDLKLEEEFEHRLGIDDKGYWVYTWNYREYLRYKIKTFTYAPGEDIQDSELLREMREGSEEHERMDAFVTESEVGR